MWALQRTAATCLGALQLCPDFEVSPCNSRDPALCTFAVGVKCFLLYSLKSTFKQSRLMALRMLRVLCRKCASSQ